LGTYKTHDFTAGPLVEGPELRAWSGAMSLRPNTFAAMSAAPNVKVPPEDYASEAEARAEA
jgi:hypothetical protein